MEFFVLLCKRHGHRACVNCVLGGITYGNYCVDFVDTWNVVVNDVPGISRALYTPYDRQSTGHLPNLVFHQGYQGSIQQQLPSNAIYMPPSFENYSKNGVAERLASARWEAHEHVSATHKVSLDCLLLRSRFRIAHLPAIASSIAFSMNHILIV